MHFKKVLSALLCGAMLLSAMPMASAAYQTPVTVTSEAAIFNVTIPTALPVSVNDHGAVTTATNATITNDSWGPIVIAGLAVTGTNNWATVDYDSANMTAEKVDTKKVAMSINTCKTTGANAINFQSSGFGGIHGKGGTQLITYDAKLPAQASAISSQNIVNTTFTVAWDMATGSASTDNVSADSNPMTSAQVTAANLAFDSSTGTIKAGSTKPTGALNLPSSVDGVKVNSISSTGFNNCTGITSVIIPNGVTSIGDNAFSGCSGLTSVIIPSSVTSIGYRVFIDCNNLKTFVSNSSAYRVENNRYLIQNSNNELMAFAPSDATTAIIPNSVTSIGNGAFLDCSKLTSVTIPNSVTTIGNNSFSYCSGLTSITIPNSITSIGDNAFAHCVGLTSVTIPNGVTSINNGVFDGCTGLTSVVIPSSITSIGIYAFRSSGLTSVTIPNSVTSIDSNAFNSCTKAIVTIPNSVTSIGFHAFYLNQHIYYTGTATGSPWGATAIN